jgi:2-polyprenyl-3-methyl-5-hydroxy-6-metoxy-1,4-benzoquinol methylase
MTYNKTQLHPEHAFERHVFHRDMFAHYLRFSHVLKIAKIGMNVLDWGCGNGNLFELFYRNRYKPKSYFGMDVRSKTIQNLQEKWKDIDYAEFQFYDLVSISDTIMPTSGEWDIITSFEVIEHIGKKHVDPFLQNIKRHMGQYTTLLISTPCYDEKVGAADNHIIDGEIGELTFTEMRDALERNGFIIGAVYGTFASQRDYEGVLTPEELTIYKNLKQYYDTNILSVFMAPLHPEQARNCLWKCKISK